MNMHTNTLSVGASARPVSQLSSMTDRAERAGQALLAAENKLDAILQHLRGSVPQAVDGAGKDPQAAPTAMRRMELAIGTADVASERLHRLIDELAGFVG
jgi:hypothetical protein